MRTLQILLLDACCLRNLYATHRLRAIALASRCQFGVVEHVITSEALFIWVPIENGNREEAEPLPLQPLMGEGLIDIFRLENLQETTAFTDFSVRMDNGEAETGAIALHRGYAIATDDRKARRVLQAMAPAVPLLSTLALVQEWAQSTAVSVSQIQEVLRAMETGVSYFPGRRDPLFAWWQSIMNR